MSTKKIVLITGATSGIGRELARCFAANGYMLFILARDEAGLNETAAMLKKEFGAEVVIIKADLSKQGEAEVVYKKLNGKVVDVLVNNAGYGTYGPFIESDPSTLLGPIRVNIEALTELTRLILPGMYDRRTGKILNVASTAAFQPGPLMAVYYATKAYVLSFSEAVRYELKDTGITITTLCPGPTETRFQKKAGFDKANLVRTGMMSAAEVARQGYEGLMDGQNIVVPGVKNKLGVVLNRLSPRSVVLKVVNKLNKTE